MSIHSINLTGTTAANVPLPPQRRMAKAEFLAWAMGTQSRAEWVDGEVLTMAAANRDHMETRRWFDDLLAMYVRRKRLGQVGDDMFVDLDGQRRLRVPDLFFVRADRLAIIEQTVLSGPPDMVLEVVSPDSQTRDRREKYLEYEEFGIQEYWIVDPMIEQVEVYALDDSGRYKPILPDASGIIRSAVVQGFWIKVAWLWPNNRPDEDDAYAEIIAT